MDNILNCQNCKETVSKIEFECSHCGFPLSGTDKEKAVFIGKQIANKSKIDEAKLSQNKVMWILCIIGGFQILNGFIAMNSGYNTFDYLFHFILGLVFIVFGILSLKRPLIFISLALVLLLSYYILLYILNPIYITQGIIWKFVWIAFLIYGLVQSFEERQIKKQNKSLR